MGAYTKYKDPDETIVCPELMLHSYKTDPCVICNGTNITKIDAMESARRLIAIADLMFAENAAIAQAKWEAEGNTSHLASPLDSAGRSYVLHRHRLTEKLGLPNAAIALGQRKA